MVSFPFVLAFHLCIQETRHDLKLLRYRLILNDTKKRISSVRLKGVANQVSTQLVVNEEGVTESQAHQLQVKNVLDIVLLLVKWDVSYHSDDCPIQVY